MHSYTADDDRIARTVVEYCLQRLSREVPLDRPLTPTQLDELVGPTITGAGIGG